MSSKSFSVGPAGLVATAAVAATLGAVAAVALQKNAKSEKPQRLGKIDRSKIVVIVPGRSGSKGVPNKNIKDFCGKPLMGWAIENGLKSKYVSKVYVSTDSTEFQKLAVSLGAEAPFLRPAEISGDRATDYECFEHFLRWMNENDPENAPSLLVQLRATAPCCTPEIVDGCIEEFLKHEDENYDSLRTVTPVDHEAFNMYKLDPYEPAHLCPIIYETHHKDDGAILIPEPQSVSRQSLPKLFWHNAYVDIMRPETILKLKCTMGKRCVAFHMKETDNIDIDTQEQWVAAEKRKRAQLAALKK